MTMDSKPTNFQIKTNETSNPLSIAATSFTNLQQLIHNQFKLHPTRQRIRVVSESKNGPNSYKLLNDQKVFAELSDGTSLLVKDLGPQVNWRLVYVVEYLGPLLIHFFLYFYGNKYVYMNAVTGRGTHRSFLQMVAFTMVQFHYVKRLFESIFIHKFSHSTMPLSSLIKNCAYYYLLGGVAIAYNLYHPAFARSRKLSLNTIRILSGLFFLFEGINFYAHLCLMALRPEGSRERRIPRGVIFKWTSAPNYLAEVLVWVVFASLTGLDSAWLFAAMGYFQMQIWANKKQQRYLREFADYPKERYAMVPFLPFQQ